MPSLRESREGHHSSKKKKKDHDRSKDSLHHGERDRHRRRSRSHKKVYERSRSKERRRREKTRHKRDREDSYESRSRYREEYDPSLSRSIIGINDTTIGSIIAESQNNALGNNTTKINMEPDVSKRKRKSRWAESAEIGKTLPGVPTILPLNLTPLQEKAFILQLQIEELSHKLRVGEWGIPEKVEDRSPSPEPIYNNLGIRMNTREVRVKKKMEEQRYTLITELIKINPEYKPPLDFKPNQQKYIDKVWIPQESYPLVNFVGLIIGPRGNTLKQLEKETGAKIIIRGKGSMKEGKIGRPDGQPLPGADEPLHAYITATTEECLKKAMDLINQIIKEAIEVPEGDNELRKNQLKQLALLNGTLRDPTASLMSIMTIKCSNCGSDAHKTWQCPEAPNITANIVCTLCGGGGHVAMDCKQLKSEGGIPGNPNQLDEEYLSLMAELGQNPVLNPAGAATKKLESITPLVKKVIETRPPIKPSTPLPSYQGQNVGPFPPSYPHQVAPRPFSTFPAYTPMGFSVGPPNPFMAPFHMSSFMQASGHENSDSQDGTSQNHTPSSMMPPYCIPMGSPYMFGPGGPSLENSGQGMLPPWAIQQDLQPHQQLNKPPASTVDPIQPPPPPPSLSGFNINPLPPPPPPQVFTNSNEAAPPQPPNTSQEVLPPQPPDE